MFVEQYQEAVNGVLSAIFTQERGKIDEAGAIVANTLKNDGLLHVFGCGHSHILAEELFYRAGGLAAVDPIFETSAMLHEGAVKSSEIERLSGYARLVVARYPIQKNDCFLVVSSSGINPFVIEMAQEASARSVATIGISSFAYRSEASRQKDGLHLPDVCDLCIDNHVPHGDASVSVRSDGTKAGPVSTIASVAIVNSIVLAACEKLRDCGIEPEVFQSGNLPDGDIRNSNLIQKYRLRVKHL
jgi:uncharacterized phosphosugar-binding protein